MCFRDVRLQILEHHRWSVMQKYRAITADLSVGDLMDFVNRFKDALYVEGLVQGNFTSSVSPVDSLFPFEKVFGMACLCVICMYAGIQGISPIFYRVSLFVFHHLGKAALFCTYFLQSIDEHQKQSVVRISPWYVTENSSINLFRLNLPFSFEWLNYLRPLTYVRSSRSIKTTLTQRSQYTIR